MYSREAGSVGGENGQHWLVRDKLRGRPPFTKSYSAIHFLTNLSPALSLNWTQPGPEWTQPDLRLFPKIEPFFDVFFTGQNTILTKPKEHFTVVIESCLIMLNWNPRKWPTLLEITHLCITNSDSKCSHIYNVTMYILQDLCTVKCFTIFSTILREIPVKILKKS